MKKSKRLPTIKPYSLALSSIKDYDKLKEIYKDYLGKRYFMMASEIALYGEFQFFRDLYIYQKENYKSDAYKSGIAEHIKELYFELLTV